MRSLILSAVIALSLVLPARSQSDFPTRPVEVIVPYSPGGVTDIIARSLSREWNRSPARLS